jgi:CheY-like chemotaxis protein
MGRRLRILIVDDDVENADSLAELFALDDHLVSVAYNGQQAVDAFEAQQFDIGFFDVMMPVKNGVESFLEIKAAHPEACVYFMTGYSTDDLLQRALDHGAKGVFSKPVDLPRVLEALNQAV